MIPFRSALVLALAVTTPAHPDASKLFRPGDFIMPFRDYDHKTDSFTNTPPKGEEKACFRVDRVTREQIDITLISGPYHPWWSDSPFPPGFTDSFVEPTGYAEHHPDAPPLELVGLTYRRVPACAPPS